MPPLAAIRSEPSCSLPSWQKFPDKNFSTITRNVPKPDCFGLTLVEAKQVLGEQGLWLSLLPHACHNYVNSSLLKNLKV